MPLITSDSEDIKRNWEQLYAEFNLRHHNQITRLTRPMREAFDLESFIYCRISNSSEFACMTDRPDWMEYYIGTEMFRVDPLIRHPIDFQPGIFDLNSFGDESQKEILAEVSAMHDLGKPYILIEVDEDGVDCYGFQGGRNSPLSNPCISEQNLTRRFCAYFKKNSQSLISDMFECGFLLEKMKDNLTCQESLRVKRLSPDQRLELLESIGDKRLVELFSRLSRREKECLGLMLDGYTSTETAIKLGLSRRTIESYFENMKAKLECDTKREILEVSKQLHYLGLL